MNRAQAAEARDGSPSSLALVTALAVERDRLCRGGAGDPDVDAALREADHEHRRPPPADPQLLRRSARHRDVRRRRQLRARGRGRRGRCARSASRRRRSGTTKATPAIVLDVDDTTLATWNYEIASNWAYNPVTNATYVTGQLFPAVPGMVATVDAGSAGGLRDLLPDGPPGRAGGRDARQPDGRRRRRGRRLSRRRRR